MRNLLPSSRSLARTTFSSSVTGKAIFEGQPRNSILLVELDGCPAEVRQQRKCLLAYMAGLAAAHREARTEAQAEKLWQVRRTCSQSMFSLADTKLNEDVVVPLEKQAAKILFSNTHLFFLRETRPEGLEPSTSNFGN